MTSRTKRMATGVLVLALAAPFAVYLYVRADLALVSEQLRVRDAYPWSVACAVLVAEDPLFPERTRFDTFRSTVAIFAGFVRDLSGRHMAVDAPPSLTQRMVSWNTHGRPLTRMLRILIVAAIVDATISKQTILDAYLHHVYLGRIGKQPIYGIKEAAHAYYGTGVEQLTLAQTVSLAAAIRSPSVLGPLATTETAVNRRLRLLAELQRSRSITDEEYRTARDALRGVCGNT